MMPRRKAAYLIADDGVDVGFVDGTPEVAEVAQRLHGMRDVALEAFGSVACEEAATRCEPEGIGEVMQRHHRLNAALVECLQHLAIALERLRIPFVHARLDASERRSAFRPIACARSKSRSAFAHQSQASPQRSPDLICPACSQAYHWLLVLPPSYWCDEVATPQRKPSGKVSVCCA